jgi:hypothetical protein
MIEKTALQLGGSNLEALDFHDFLPKMLNMSKLMKMNHGEPSDDQ